MYIYFLCVCVFEGEVEGDIYEEDNNANEGKKK